MTNQSTILVLLLASASISCNQPVEPTPAPEPEPAAEPEPPSEKPEQPEPTIEPQTPKVDPGPPTPRYGELPSGHRPIIVVPQTTPTLTRDLWSFAEKRPLLINEGGDNCEIFDIPTGTIVSALPLGPKGCPMIDATGAPASVPSPFEYAFDQQRRLEVEDGVLLIYDQGDQVLHRLSCEGCGWGKWAWAPSDHRLAYLSLDPLRLDIWDADTGKRLESHALGSGADPSDAMLVWNERGVVGLIHELHEIRETSVVASVFWPNAGGRVVHQRSIAVDTTLDEVEHNVDPGMRWLVVYEEKQERGGEAIRSRLTMKPLADLPSKLDWRWYQDNSEAGEHWIEVNGHWRSDATTQWLEGITDTWGPTRNTSLEMSWRGIVMDPEPDTGGKRLHRGSGYDDDDLVPLNQPVGIRDGKVVISWAIDPFSDRRPKTMPLEDGCDLVDASPKLDLLLARCAYSESGLFDAKRETLRLQLHLARNPELRWGKTNWLAVREWQADVVIVDLDRVEVRDRKKLVVSLAKVALANQQDRLGLVFEKEFELIDAITGDTLLKLPRFAGQAALHPEGHSFAYIHEGELRILDLATGKQVRSWPEPQHVDVAWRQDGAALLVGTKIPSAVVDATTGTPIATLTEGNWKGYPPEHIDPSWRFIRLADGRIMRTLDGMTLTYGSGWVRLDIGVYDGDVDFGEAPLRDLLYNVGEDPFAVPHLDSKDLDPWLRRPGLAAAFFAGETIAPASIPIAEADALAHEH
jgi:hypothetical protein